MDFFPFHYRNRADEYEDPRRAFLVKLLTMGAFAAGGGLMTGIARGDGVFAKRPRELPPGQSIHRLAGEVWVNGRQADMDTRIRPDDAIETGSAGELVFVVGRDAFMLRENSRLELAGSAADLPTAGSNGNDTLADSVISGLRLLTGKVLSVFGERGPGEDLNLHTLTATIGVRGTGVYLESETDRSYVCTCYGTTRLAATGAAGVTEEITSSHHDAPRYIHGDGSARIEPAPVINHTDMELLLIETLVGRRPPFPINGNGNDSRGTPNY